MDMLNVGNPSTTLVSPNEINNPSSLMMLPDYFQSKAKKYKKKVAFLTLNDINPL